MDIFKNYEVKFLKSLPNWEDVEKVDISQQDWTEGYKPKSFGQAVFIDGLGLLVRISTNQINPIIKASQDGDPVHEDSALEFFCSFDDCKSYMNLEANAAGVRNCSWRKVKSGNPVRLHNAHSNLTATPFIDKNSWSLIYTLPTEIICKYFTNLQSEDIKPGFIFRGNFYHMGSIPTKDLEQIKQKIELNGDSLSSKLLAVEQNPYYYLMWNKVINPHPAFHCPEYFGYFKIV